MAASTVIGRLANPVSALPASGAVTIVLVDYADTPVLGFDAADQTEILSSCTVIPDQTSGLWTAQLVPNASIQLANGSAQTAYRVTAAGADATDVYWILVTASGSPLWVGNIRIQLPGSVGPGSIAGLAVTNLTVAGAFTYDGYTIATPPNDPLRFLNGAGAFSVPGGGPPSGAAGGDLAGSYPNPTLAGTANVNAIVRASRLDQMAAPAAAVSMASNKLTSVAAGTAPTDAANLGQIPTSLPPNGTASGDLAGAYPAPTLAGTANVLSIIRGNRLDQMAAPNVALPMNGQKITGGAAGAAGTDFAIVSQLPTALPPNGTAGGDLSGSYPNPGVAKLNGITVTGTPNAGDVLTATGPAAAHFAAQASARDPYTAMLGLVSQPYPLDATDHDDLGSSAGFLILALNRPGAGLISNLGLWQKLAGTGPGPASMAVFPGAGGAQLATTGDMSAALTNAANNDTYVEAPLTAPYMAADGVDYYYGLFTNLTADVKIAGVFGASSTLHIPSVKGNRPMIVIGGLSAMPSSINVAAASTAGAAYWLVGS